MRLVASWLSLVVLTMNVVSVYVHRYQTHGVVELPRWLASLGNLYVRILLGIDCESWRRVHAEHHQNVDQADDPHSPHVYGFVQVVFGTILLHYRAGERMGDDDLPPRYEPTYLDRLVGRACWPGTQLPIASYGFFGAVSFSIIGYAIGSGAIMGFVLWALVALTCALLFGFVNAFGHAGPNFENSKLGRSKDLPQVIALLLGGESYHMQHHQNPGRLRLGRFDTGGWLLELLIICGLATRRA